MINNIINTLQMLIGYRIITANVTTSQNHLEVKLFTKNGDFKLVLRGGLNGSGDIQYLIGQKIVQVEILPSFIFKQSDSNLLPILSEATEQVIAIGTKNSRWWCKVTTRPDINPILLEVEEHITDTRRETD